MANITMLQGFEWYLPADHNHWNRLKSEAKRFQNAKIGMVWLPPAYKGSSGRDSVGYDVYDRYDLGEFDQKGTVATKYGTKDAYLACIRALQDKGIKVLADIVVNHLNGADACEEVTAAPYDPHERMKQLGEKRQIKAWTRFTFTGRNGAYSDEIWDHTDFNAVDYDGSSGKNGLYLFNGRDWNQETDWEFGVYDYLMGANIDIKNSDTMNKLINWGKWYLDITGADGLRLDAVKHISYEFITIWLAAMRRHAGEDFFTVAEYWSGEPSHLLPYLDQVNDACSLFDVPLHYAFHNASSSDGEYDMRHLYQGSLLTNRPEHAVTFVENHDTQPGQSLESPVLPWFKKQAYAMILFQEKGIPCVFYGDIFGIPYSGLGPVMDLEHMCMVRYRCAYGKQTDYMDHENVVGYTRSGSPANKYSGMAVLVTNGCGGVKDMYVNVRFKGEKFINMLDPDSEPVYLDAHGTGHFYVKDGSAAVWIRESAYNYLKSLSYW